MGYSLLDLLLSTMVSIIIISICYSLIFFQLKQLRQVKALYVQNVILAHIKTSVSSRSLIASAADPVNVDLRTCLAGVDNVRCTSSDVYDLKLVDGSVIAGFPADPVGYNLDAQTCAVGSSRDCIFTLKTRFRVQCAEDPLNPLFVPPICPTTRPGLVEVYYEFGSTASTDADRILGLKAVLGSIIVKM